MPDVRYHLCLKDFECGKGALEVRTNATWIALGMLLQNLGAERGESDVASSNPVTLVA
jgi:hypothetical protein